MSDNIFITGAGTNFGLLTVQTMPDEGYTVYAGGPAVRGEILRRRHRDLPVVGADPDRDHVLVDDLARTYRSVEALSDEVANRVGDGHIQDDVRRPDGEPLQRRRDFQPRGHAGGDQTDGTARSVGDAARVRQRAADGLHRRSPPVRQRLAGRREGDAPRGAVKSCTPSRSLGERMLWLSADDLTPSASAP